MSLIKNTTAAERQVQCVFGEHFQDLISVNENGGEAFGTPTFNNGVTLNGTTDYVKYESIGNIAARNFSAVVKFIPDFDTDANALYYFYSSTGGYTLFKHNNASNNIIRVVIDGVIIADIPEATYSPAWNVGEENTIVVSSKNGDTDVWLNDTKILDNDASAWTVSNFGTMYIGASNAMAWFFDGEIKSVKFFTTKLADRDAMLYLDNSIYSYINDMAVDLPMRMQDHDPDNSRTLDRSGNDNHAVWVDGSTAPTKNTERLGYDWNAANSQVMNIASSASNTFGDGATDSPFSISFWAKMDTASDFFAVMKRDGNVTKEYQLGIATNRQIFFVLHDDSTGGLIGRTAAGFTLDIYEGQWVHIVGTYDGNGNPGMRFYVNAIRRDANNNSSGSYVAMENTGTPIVLGDLLGLYADGTMALLKIIPSELTPLQVNDLYIRESKMLNRI